MSEKYPQQALPVQRQHTQPGEESSIDPHLVWGKFEGKIAVIIGGDSGIGRAVAVAFAKEGADTAIVYLSEDNDATCRRVLRHTGVTYSWRLDGGKFLCVGS